MGATIHVVLECDHSGCVERKTMRDIKPADLITDNVDTGGWMLDENAEKFYCPNHVMDAVSSK